MGQNQVSFIERCPLFSSFILSPSPSLISEKEIVDYYRMMKSYSRGDAVIRYLEIIATLPMYSMHYFNVKVCAVLLRAEWSVS